MFGLHSRNQDEFTVGFFSKPKFIFLFCKEAVRIVRLWNSLDYLDCSLVVFYIIFFISGSKSLSPSMKAVVITCACAISPDHLDFRQLCKAQVVKIRMNSLSVLFRDGSSYSFFWLSCLNLQLMRTLLIIWIAVMVPWQYFSIKILFQEPNFSAINEGSC